MVDDEAQKYAALPFGNGFSPAISLRVAGFWIGFWILVVLAIIALSHRGIALEDIQTIAFPILVFIFWRISLGIGITLPRGLICMALFLWILGALHVRGYYPAEFFNEGIYLGRLADDAGGAGRELYQRYNQIAKHYGLPPMYLLHRSVGDESSMGTWLNQHEKATLLLGGNKEWLDVTLPTDRPIEEQKEHKPYSSAALYEAREQFKVPVQIGLKAVRIPGTDHDLLLVLNPPKLSLPWSPTELVRHYLAWLAQGLSPDKMILSRGVPAKLGDVQALNYRAEFLRELRLFHFGNASFVDGPWKSYAPRALAIFYAANVELEEAINEKFNSRKLEFIADLYGRAAAKVRERYDTDLYAAIYNNAAIAQLLLGAEDDQFKKVEKLLNDAASSRAGNGQRSVIGPIAMINSKVGRSLGLIP